MRIAVVGAGIFGCTVAIHLARKEHEVVLIEKQDSILRGATTANQLRLHRGFHYPRSPETIAECKSGSDLFREEYGPAVDYGGRQFYALARDSEQQTNPMQYEKVVRDNGLVLRLHENPPFTLNYDYIEACYEVSEAHINLPILRNLVWQRLFDWGVDCRFECDVAIDDDTFSGYDKVILCTYGNEAHSHLRKRYELIEKPVIFTFDPQWEQNSLVVMDGPFFSCDPLLGSPHHLLGHVMHCIHDAYDSALKPEFDHPAMMFVDKGCVPASHLGGTSNFVNFLDDIERFWPGIGDCDHLGSYFTIRTVLSGVDSTDERPTIVTPIDDKYINVFSGKIGNCVDAALEVAELCSQ